MTSTSQAPAAQATSASDTSVSDTLLDNPWIRFALRRAGQLLISLWVLVTASFLMIHLVPGDPVRASLGLTAPQSLVNARRDELGLNDPLLVQYWHYLRDLLTGDFGTSMSSQLPVSQIISQRLPATLSLAVSAFVLALLIAVPLGALMGVVTRAGRAQRTELTFTTVSVIIGAIPDFVVCIILVWIFGVNLHMFPVAGKSGLSSYVLPVIALAIGPGVILARILRVELIAVLQADYIRTARAKRLPAVVIYLKHALPNALTATLTLSGLLLSGLIAGTVLVENVFAWPGLGSTIVSSIQNKDYPVVQAIVLVYGVLVLLINLVVDVALALLDPRSTIREN